MHFTIFLNFVFNLAFFQSTGNKSGFGKNDNAFFDKYAFLFLDFYHYLFKSFDNFYFKTNLKSEAYFFISFFSVIGIQVQIIVG